MISIDVIIPSYRLQSEYLIPIIQMDIPFETNVRFLIIADNPNEKIPEDFLSLVDNEKVILFSNKENKGAHKSRNVGLDNSKAVYPECVIAVMQTAPACLAITHAL